jgi:CRISPR-associated protein (Cas_Cas02710)
MTLASLWLEYKALSPSQRQAFLEQQIQPVLFASLEPTIYPAPEISIHTLGTSIEPTIIAARKIRAESVVILGTRESLRTMDLIKKYCLDQNVFSIEVDRAGTSSVFRAVEEATREYQNIALEITSGTKAMVAALSMMAMKLQTKKQRVQVFYVDNPQWDADLHRPVPGFEQLVQLDIP